MAAGWIHRGVISCDPFADGTKDAKLAFEKLESGRAVGKVVVEM
jgi:NADPH-dependent curcumin reductase CurA